MIYITLDTCVWLQLLYIDFKNEDNYLEEICYWIENKHIIHIVPINIINEWNRHKITYQNDIIKYLKKKEGEDLSLFKHNAELASTYNAEELQKSVEKRIQRIDSIFSTHSEKAPHDDSILQEAGIKNLQTLPPNHKKDSFRDTVNLLSLIKYLKTKGYTKSIFTTINYKDFSADGGSRYELHNDLKTDFSNVNLEYEYFGENDQFGTKLFNRLRIELSGHSFQAYLKEKKDKAEEARLAERKTVTTTPITSPDADYLENIRHLDVIIAKKRPTTWELEMVKSLIGRHDSYEQYFLKNIGTMEWFNFLKTEGYFDINKNPEPIQVKNGFQTPHWESLTYLEKLSIQISKGKELELIDELLILIKNVSEHPKDNYWTWYLFIKILSNIPNDRISNDILHFIPVWLSGEFDTMLQTSELCDKLLPKFLDESPTQADIEKAEIILYYLFQVERIVVQDDIFKGKRNSYRSRLDLHFLAYKFEKKNITPKVVKYCSSDFILDLGRTLKFLFFDYPNGINSLLKDGENEYEINIQIEKENLLISSKSKTSEVTHSTSHLSNWEDKNEDELKKELVSIFKQQKIDYTPTNESNDTFQRLYLALNTDLTPLFGFHSIRKLGNRYSTSEAVLHVFSLIFRDLLDEQAKQNPEKALELLKTICFDSKYRIPFYKRISLYVICENWDTTKSLFWELLKENNALRIFSYDKYQKEVFDLLNRNQKALNADEISIIDSIIEQGTQIIVEEEREREREYWKLGWYSALKDIDPFKDKYLLLSKKLDITSDHYEGLGEVHFRSGNISPLTMDDLLKKSNQEIVEYIKTFNPKRHFEEPSISGLSETFGRAVETDPEKFAAEIGLYQGIPYIYSYHMLNAFGEAWKKQKTFDWEKILQYCRATLINPKFYGEELQIENDTWHAKSDWVVGSIANLLTDGLQNDNNAFDIKLLPLAKEIIQIIINNLKYVDDSKEKEKDIYYPTYSLNSTAGKSLRALFDYSLHRARNLFKREDKEKWETDIKSLFEETLQKGIIDGFILEGMYFEQFCFLDYNWIIEQIKKHYKSENREWLAFMGGLAVSSPPYNKELYDVFYPHYERAIDNNISLEHFSNNGLVNHLTAFYFWKYETLISEKLLFKFVNQTSPSQVGELIHFIWRQEDYPKTLSELEHLEFQQIIIALWSFLTDKYENSNIEEEQKNLATLSNWIVFVPELNEVYTSLILKSCKYIDKTYPTHELLEYLVQLKSKGNPKTTAKAVGSILSSLNFRDYMADKDQDFIKDLVLFLFTNGEKQVASNFCNTMAAVHNQLFLREIYEENTKTQD